MIIPMESIKTPKRIIKKQLKNVNKAIVEIAEMKFVNIEDKDEFVKKLGEKKIWIRVLEDPKWFRACVHQMTTAVSYTHLTLPTIYSV